MYIYIYIYVYVHVYVYVHHPTHSSSLFCTSSHVLSLPLTLSLSRLPNSVVLSLSPSLSSLSPFLSASLSVSLSVSFSLFLSLSFSIYLSLFLSLPLSLSLPLPLSLTLSLSFSLSLLSQKLCDMTHSRKTCQIPLRMLQPQNPPD